MKKLSLFHRYIIKYPSKPDPDDDNDVTTADEYARDCQRFRRKQRQTQQQQISNLQMGVVSFCKAFPWHFIMDRKLELIQLGAGFTRLFSHKILLRHGMAAATYFHFHRPRGLVLTFPEIIKRANTPFVLLIRKPAVVDEFPAEVRIMGFVKLCRHVCV